MEQTQKITPFRAILTSQRPSTFLSLNLVRGLMTHEPRIHICNVLRQLRFQYDLPSSLLRSRRAGKMPKPKVLTKERLLRGLLGIAQLDALPSQLHRTDAQSPPAAYLSAAVAAIGEGSTHSGLSQQLTNQKTSEEPGRKPVAWNRCCKKWPYL
jgi:hypothetical protein